MGNVYPIFHISEGFSSLITICFTSSYFNVLVPINFQKYIYLTLADKMVS